MLSHRVPKKNPTHKKNWKIYCFCNCLLQWLPKIAGISIKVHIRLINIIKIRLRRELPPKKNPTDAWYVLISLSLSLTHLLSSQTNTSNISFGFGWFVSKWKHVHHMKYDLLQLKPKFGSESISNSIFFVRIQCLECISSKWFIMLKLSNHSNIVVAS